MGQLDFTLRNVFFDICFAVNPGIELSFDKESPRGNKQILRK